MSEYFLIPWFLKGLRPETRHRRGCVDIIKRRVTEIVCLLEETRHLKRCSPSESKGKIGKVKFLTV